MPSNNNLNAEQTVWLLEQSAGPLQLRTVKVHVVAVLCSSNPEPTSIILLLINRLWNIRTARHSCGHEGQSIPSGAQRNSPCNQLQNWPTEDAEQPTGVQASATRFRMSPTRELCVRTPRCSLIPVVVALEEKKKKEEVCRGCQIVKMTNVPPSGECPPHPHPPKGSIRRQVLGAG